MGTVLEFRPLASTSRRERRDAAAAVSIVIFPGVRIERHDDGLDLGYRLRDSAGRDDFKGLGRKRRPRKTS